MRKGGFAGEISISSFETSVGFGAVVATPHGLLEVFLPFGILSRSELDKRVVEVYPGTWGETPLSREAARLLLDYFAGEPVVFDLPLDERCFTPFQRRVYALVRCIPRGDVMTYGQVATSLGMPSAARGVGGAMARNPLPVVIPCHRVLGAGGALTGYSGSGGIDSKKWLLDLERGCNPRL